MALITALKTHKYCEFNQSVDLQSIGLASSEFLNLSKELKSLIPANQLCHGH